MSAALITGSAWLLAQGWLLEPAVPELDPDQVTSGPLGFAIIALSALAVIGLSFPLVRTLRRIEYREQVRQKIAAELAAQQDGNAAPGEPGQYSGSSQS